MSKEAMIQALEHMEWSTPQGKAAYEGLRQAILDAEKQEQGEPVGFYDASGNDICTEIPMGESGDWWQPVYTTPQQRKPLTDEQIMGIARITCIGISPHEDTLNFARVIEAAHGIKEKNT
jgi:hypothetical protein